MQLQAPNGPPQDQYLVGTLPLDLYFRKNVLLCDCVPAGSRQRCPSLRVALVTQIVKLANDLHSNLCKIVCEMFGRKLQIGVLRWRTILVTRCFTVSGGSLISLSSNPGFQVLSDEIALIPKCFPGHTRLGQDGRLNQLRALPQCGWD
jgi:hypothetical protein